MCVSLSLFPLLSPCLPVSLSPYSHIQCVQPLISKFSFLPRLSLAHLLSLCGSGFLFHSVQAFTSLYPLPLSLLSPQLFAILSPLVNFLVSCYFLNFTQEVYKDQLIRVLQVGKVTNHRVWDVRYL